MIRDVRGDLFDSDADAVVNTVNTVGVMGKGLALQSKQRYPDNFAQYRDACAKGQVELGRMFVHDTGQIIGPRWIINFPTKAHWRSRSRLRDIEAGLDDLVEVLRSLEVRRVAVPPLGCGHGGLDWSDVRPVIEAKLGGLDTNVDLYPPPTRSRSAG